MKKWINIIAALPVVLGSLLASCVDDHEMSCPSLAKEPDAELMLTVKFDMGSSTKIGDPGTDHGEDVADWKNLGIFLVYETGQVLPFNFTKETFTTPKIYNVFAGKADVFVVALPEEQQLPDILSAENIRSMKTLDVSTLASDTEKAHYMRNLFSGVSKGLVISSEASNTVNVICRRLVAKVDMQYDVQDGIDGGQFVEASMSEITFKGVPQSYIFPEVAGTLNVGDADLMKLSGNISERNGRAYSYMFPGDASMLFKVDYQTEEKPAGNAVNYIATFQSPLNVNTWYKVNFTVSGKNASASGSVEVKIQ